MTLAEFQDKSLGIYLDEEKYGSAVEFILGKNVYIRSLSHLDCIGTNICKACVETVEPR